MRVRLALVALFAGMLACCGHPTGTAAPVPRPTPSLAPSPLPTPTSARYRSDWSTVPDGAAPPEFVGVTSGAYPWLYDGGWRIDRQAGVPVLVVPFNRTDPPEPLTFRRFAGDTFGPDGALPAHYRVSLVGASLGGSSRFDGYGELACEVAYLSPVRYVEVLQTDAALDVWEADDAPPMQGKGWHLLASLPHPAVIGQWVAFGAEVDNRSGTVTATLDGQPVATVHPTLLPSGTPLHFTLRATGNREEWRSLEVEQLP